MFRKYKNKKVIAEHYKNGDDITCYTPSVKKLMIETEFLVTQAIESYRLDYISHNLNPVDGIRENLLHIMRSSLIKALVETGRVQKA